MATRLRKTWMWAVALLGLAAELALPAANVHDPLRDCRERSSVPNPLPVAPLEDGGAAEEPEPIQGRTHVFRMASRPTLGWSVPPPTGAPAADDDIGPHRRNHAPVGVVALR